MTTIKHITHSKRLFVRHLNFDDHISLFNIYSDKEAMKFRSNPPLCDIEEATEMIKYSLEQIENKKEFRFAIIEKETNKLIGTFLYKVINQLTCEIGYSLGKNYWKLGYGYEILSTMVAYLEEINFQHLIATTKKENTDSINLLTKSGFKLNENKNSKEIYWFEKTFEIKNLR